MILRNLWRFLWTNHAISVRYTAKVTILCIYDKNLQGSMAFSNNLHEVLKISLKLPKMLKSVELLWIIKCYNMTI